MIRLRCARMHSCTVIESYEIPKRDIVANRVISSLACADAQQSPSDVAYDFKILEQEQVTSLDLWSVRNEIKNDLSSK